MYRTVSPLGSPTVVTDPRNIVGGRRSQRSRQWHSCCHRQVNPVLCAVHHQLWYCHASYRFKKRLACPRPHFFGVAGSVANESPGDCRTIQSGIPLSDVGSPEGGAGESGRVGTSVQKVGDCFRRLVGPVVRLHREWTLRATSSSTPRRPGILMCSLTDSIPRGRTLGPVSARRAGVRCHDSWRPSARRRRDPPQGTRTAMARRN